ncbi:hypothetical protein [Streptomyces chrestomyceticus]|uniref:hypothetical protein n=1 Tax=Streptomyces chrestomyceticus TaxID=68185 RepID=UPI0033F4774C
MAEQATPKKRKSAKAVEARKAAALRAAKFQQAEAQRLEIAADLELARAEIEAFEEETERQVRKLRERREKLLTDKRAAADRLVVKMLDTGVPQAEAAQRLGLGVDQVRTAKTNHEELLLRHLQAKEDQQHSPDEAPGVADGPDAGGAATIPQQTVREESREAAAGGTQPPGSAG